MTGKHNDELNAGLDMKSTFWFRLWSIVSLLAVIHLIVFDALIVSAPEILQVQYTPDDGYYYLALARNFVRFGQWTFDGGNSLTSGFHLLQGYMLALGYRLFHPTSSGFVLLGLAASLSVTLLVVLLFWRMCLRKREPLFLLVFTIVITARSFLFNSVSITEWSFVILVAGLYCAYFDNERGNTNLLVPLGLGLLGSLARSDFGLLPFSIFVSTFLVTFRRRWTATLRSAIAGLVGATLGVGLVILHNFFLTGELLQSSARIKSYWAHFSDQKLYSSVSLLPQTLGLDLDVANFDRSLFLFAFFMISGALLLLIFSRKSGQRNIPAEIFKLDPQQPVHERMLVLAAALCTVGYVVLYTVNGAVQNWYTANLVWPIFILCVAGARYLQSRILAEYQFTMIWLSVFVVASVCVQIPSLYPLSSQTSPWPHQQVMQTAGLYLQQHPLDAHVGSWNGGIIGYYEGGTSVINIDGLVNNDVYPYVISNHLPDYLREKNISYLLDFENMFHPPFTKRGGYDDADFLGHLTVIKEFDHGEFDEFKFLRLYRIDR